MVKILFLFLLFFSRDALAFWVGNPASPTFFQQGIISSFKNGASLRIGYLSDFTYNSKFKEEFLRTESEPLDVKISTYAGLIILNLGKKIDFYGILGASKLKEADVFIPRRFSWGLGAKATFYRYKKFNVGGDVKYFFSDQKPNHFIIDNMAASLLSEFTLKYSELQGAVAASYKCGVFVPYLGLTYLDAKIKPSHPIGVIEFMNMILEFEAASAINRRKWGMVMGLTLVSAKTMTLNIESRFFDQSAINVSGEIRF